MSLLRKRKSLSRSSSTRMYGGTTVDNKDGQKADPFATNSSSSPSFQETTVADAKTLTDGFYLSSNKDEKIVLPFIGYGTYKLGKEIARSMTLEALRHGYRCVDTAFIYGGETTEKQVGLAIQDAIEEGVLKNGRKDLFLITKHWRKYHGYEPANKCLDLSLKRLQLDYIDLW